MRGLRPPDQGPPINRRWIEIHGRFVPQNINAPRSKVSYTWNALLPHWIEWRSIVEEFLAAIDGNAVGVKGDIGPLFTFVNETLGEPWDLHRWLVTGDDYLQERKGDYDFGDAWPHETHRFLAADRQAQGGEHYFWVCRAFGGGGASRLVGYGRCNTPSELEEVRKATQRARHWRHDRHGLQGLGGLSVLPGRWLACHEGE